MRALSKRNNRCSLHTLFSVHNLKRFLADISIYIIDRFKFSVRTCTFTPKPFFNKMTTVVKSNTPSNDVIKCSKLKWFHCQVLNILWRHFMVYKSTDHRKLLSFCFLIITEKSGRVTSDIIFIVCSVRDNSYKSISEREV